MALGKAVVNITANLAPLKRGLAAAQLSVKRAFTGLATKSLTGLNNAVRRVTASIVRLAKILITTFVAAVAASIKAASDFQTQMQFVNTMLDNKADPIMEEFTQTISEMSKEFGESTKNLTSGLFDILSASIDAAKATDILAVASKAAVGGLTDVKTTTSALLTIMDSYGMEAEDATEISDKMFAAFKRGRFTIGDLATSIGRVATTASIANLSLEETLAILAATTRKGINMAEAVTSLNSVLRAFLSPTNEAVEAAKEFGLEMSSTTLETIGFSGAVKKLKKATAEQLAAILPNIRGFKALATAVGDLKGLQLDLALISEDSAGRTQKAFEKMSDTVGFQSKRLRQQVIATGRALGKPLLGPFELTILDINRKFNELETIIKRNSEKIAGFANSFRDELQILEGDIKSLLHAVEFEGLVPTIKKMTEEALETVKDIIRENRFEMEEFMLDFGTKLGGALLKGFGKGVVGIAAALKQMATDVALETGAVFKEGVNLLQARGRNLQLEQVRQQRLGGPRGTVPVRVGDF